MIGEVIDYVKARLRLLALCYFGARDADCDKLLKHTTSGNAGVNKTMTHVAQDDLPFGASGQAAWALITGSRASAP